MKIRALRVAECGRFTSPVALENLSGGLDVLAGVNELGKSTLLRALDLALREKHTANKAEITDLRPYGGGAPTVEIDFEAAGRRWRLNKQFLSGKSARLADLDSGISVRNQEAEERLEQILGGAAGRGRFSLLWVKQRSGFEPKDVDDKQAPLLQAAIAAEVETIAGGSEARRVRQAVRAALAELETEKQNRKKGRYAEAEKRVRATAEHLAAATRRQAESERQRGELARIRTTERQLAAPEAEAARAAALQERRAALEAAQEAAQQLEAARTTLAEAKARHGTAAAALGGLERDLAALTDLTRRRAEARDQSDTLGATIGREAEALASLDAQAATLHHEQAHRDAALNSALAATARQHADQRLHELSERLAQADERLARRAELAASVRDRPRLARLLESGRRATALLRELQARLEAASARVEVHYAPGATVRIATDGRDMGDGAALLASEPLRLTVPGVGEILVTPAASAATLGADMAAHEQGLAALLAEAGAADVEALAARVAALTAEDGELAALDAELKTLVPAGRDALARAVAEARAAAAAHGAAPASEPCAETPDTLALRLAEVTAALKAVDTDRTTRAAGLARLQAEAAGLAAGLAAAEKQMADLTAALPAPDARADRHAALRSERDAAAAALDTATRLVSAWGQKAPDAGRLAALKAAAAAAEDAIRTADRERARLATEAARIEGELAALDNDDVDAEAVAAAEAAAEARDAYARVDEEVRALKLIEAEIAAEKAALHERYMEPVTTRLGPLIDLVLPGARVGLSGDFGVETVTRGPVSEALGRLSDGTREQLAVLTRLAFARLLADQGQAAPLILDDALVYSDDERLAAMFRALEKASATHQVLVLTCRAASFAGLEGRRAELVPWAGA